MSSAFNFAKAILSWFDQHGRKNLPWQHHIEPYRVWLSEVMLQQTQVDTVIPYFTRFIEKFPTVFDLALAPQDEVLHLWTGLGYYARARNLHACAQKIVEDYHGEFPQDADELQLLPGIGKSTARAITSITFNKADAILDGNVKRVLARFHAVDGWPGNTKVESTLWEYAEQHMPQKRCADYTQAIMDLGATLCKRSKPDCPNCPMNTHCQAYKNDAVARYPGKKPSKATPTKTTTMLIVQDENQRLLLKKRPDKGIWGGLWSFLEFEDADQALSHSIRYGKNIENQTLGEIKHIFSHYKLMITPLNVKLKLAPTVKDSDTEKWIPIDECLRLGLAAPVKRLIESLQANT